MKREKEAAGKNVGGAENGSVTDSPQPVDG